MLKKFKRKDVELAVNITFDGIIKQLLDDSREYINSLKDHVIYEFSGGKKWWTLQWWKRIPRSLTDAEKHDKLREAFPRMYIYRDCNGKELAVLSKQDHKTKILKRDILEVMDIYYKLKKSLASSTGNYVYLDTINVDFVDNSKEFIVGESILTNG